MPIVFNGTTINSVVFNGSTMTSVVFNGTTVFTSYNYTWTFYGSSPFFQFPDIYESGFYCGDVSGMQALLNSVYPPNSYPGFYAQVYDSCYQQYFDFYSI
jgi:hypothetical protein